MPMKATPLYAEPSNPLTEYEVRVRERLIEAARTAFCEEGYQVSVSRIAQRAGVARQTLYNHFGAKDALFAQAIRSGCALLIAPMLVEGLSLRDGLIEFGVNIRKMALDERSLANFRLLVSETVKFPELGAIFYENGPERVLRHLSGHLGKAMTQGALRQDDPDFAAEMLHNMLLGIERTRRLLHPASQPQQAEDRNRVARIIDCFLNAFAVEGPTQ
jgi:TetR/AcrR family transcriptional repressor of mexJK operon